MTRFYMGEQATCRDVLWQAAGCGRDGFRMAGISHAVGCIVHRYGIFCIFSIIDVVVLLFGRAAGMRCGMAWKRVAACGSGTGRGLHRVTLYLVFFAFFQS